jgi:hypothetical protein
VKGFIIMYLDDIVIFLNSVSEYIEHLKAVFKVLRKNRLYAKPLKYILAARELEFYRHIIGNRKLQPIRLKINVILY